jgi:hypothetical protein
MIPRQHSRDGDSKPVWQQTDNQSSACIMAAQVAILPE